MSAASVLSSSPHHPRTTPGLLSSPRSASASGGALSYESFAPRSATQVNRLQRLATLTAGPVVTTSGATTTTTTTTSPTSSLLLSRACAVATLPPTATTTTTTSTTTSTSPVGTNEDAASQPDDTTTTTTPVLVARALTDADAWALHATTAVKHTTSLRLGLRASLNIAQDIGRAHDDLIRHSGELATAADRLEEEAVQLEHHAATLGQPLEHYNAVDRIGVQVGVLFKGTHATVRGLAKLKVDHDEYPPVLDEIDQAVAYFAKESGGRLALQQWEQNKNKSTSQGISGNLEYYRRATVLQEAALFLIREAVADRIRTTAQQIAQQQQQKKLTAIQADQLEASVLFTRFHGISKRSNRLMQLVQSRMSSLTSGDVYRELDRTCKRAYCTSRESLLRATLRQHMDSLVQLHGPTGMVRLGSVFLVRLVQLETNLYRDFFGSTTTTTTDSDADNTATTDATKTTTTTTTTALLADGELQNYLASLCTALHRTVRRSLVNLSDLDTLCQIVSVLREEGQQASQQPLNRAAARAMSTVMEDAQERLIFCANSTLQKYVVRFKATPQDLDYPNKLLAKKKQQQQQATKSAADATPSATTTVGETKAAEDHMQQMYESWFPPLRTVLRILSKIFRVVEPRVFEDMALQSVQACTKSLLQGAKFLTTARNLRTADLFLVQHLLVLREQLSPFDTELRTVERQLDFSEAGKAVARFLADRHRRIFAVKENALLNLLREGVTVQEAAVDSKRDLELALRQACTDFIEHAVDQTAAGPKLRALADRFQMASGSSTSGASSSSSLVTAQDVTQAQEIHKVLVQESPVLLEDMELYLEPTSQAILLKPVQRKILRILDDIKKKIATDNEEPAVQLKSLLHEMDQLVKGMKRS